MAAPPPRPEKGASKPWLKGQTEDLASLPNLDDAVLLEELRVRYDADKIYTYVGDILVAVNPFREIPIYTADICQKYNDSVKSAAPPHIYAIADQAYYSMIRTSRPQVAVISGESGAGKTESAKYMVKQIIHLCHSGADGLAIERKIIQVNPLLEAFGNAQTLMNHNSSRFGKFTQLLFTSRGNIVGAEISEYLLEKSRVVGQVKGECSFHIFYYLFGSPDAAAMGLTRPDQFPYVGEDPQQRIKRAPALYKELTTALNDVGFSGDEQRNIAAILAAILHLGIINYDAVYSDNDPAQMSCPESVPAKIAELLKVDVTEMKTALTVNITMTRGEVIRRPYLVHQAVDVRDAFAKALYGRLFGWIVSQINTLLAPSSQDRQGQLQSLGILDIFGFEHFQKNGFEQMCINVANEQLQNFFNQHIFKSELEEYKKEGIDATKITFTDNQPLLDLFLGKPIGVFALLDEETHFPKSTDASLAAKYKKEFSGKSGSYTPVKTDDPFFTIAHYAGSVGYTATGFLEKNRDTLAMDLVSLCQGSKNSMVADIFLSEITATGSMAQVQRDARGRVAGGDNPRHSSVSGAVGTSAHKRATTVGSHFTHSLRILVDKMLQCNAHFVRCIKPNTTQSAKNFVPDFVQAQLRYTGMLETTRIRREGYSYRPTFADFMERFGLLAFSPTAKIQPSQSTCEKVMKVSGLQGWLMGKTKVFLKYWHVEQLDKQLRVFQSNAIALQQLCRGFIARRRRRRILNEQTHHSRAEQEFFTAMKNSIRTVLARLQSTGTQDTKRKGVFPKSAQVDLRPHKSEAELKREASIMWWKEKEATRCAGMDLRGNFLPWFHGLISRKDSERLLAPRNPGCFLVRVSENRFGYTLSYRIADRCRHYIVEQDTKGRYALVGVSKVCSSLNELVEWFQRNRINEDGDMLREPCGQELNERGEEQCDYGELLPAGQTGARRTESSGAGAPPPISRDRKPSDVSAASKSKPPPLPAEDDLPPPPIVRGLKPK